MKKSQLKQLIREEISKVVNETQHNPIELELNINDLFYILKNSDDMTMAGVIDSYLIDNKFGGDGDKYDMEDGYSIRDSIISQLTSGLQNKLETLLYNITK